MHETQINARECDIASDLLSMLNAEEHFNCILRKTAMTHSHCSPRTLPVFSIIISTISSINVSTHV